MTKTNHVRDPSLKIVLIKQALSLLKRRNGSVTIIWKFEFEKIESLKRTPNFRKHELKVFSALPVQELHVKLKEIIV